MSRTKIAATVAQEAAVWTTGFLALAFAVRTVRYLAHFPLWGDEAAVALNLLDRGFGDLLTRLDYGQLAPPGFLMGARATLLALGTSEIALRLAPFAAALGSVGAFAWQSRLVTAEIRPRPVGVTALPVALFAVSYYLVRYAAELKPYSLDVLVACLVPGLAARWLASLPGRDASLGALAALGCVGPWFSYPTAFVVGGAALGLLPAVVRRRSGRTWVLWSLLAAGAALGSGSVYLLVGRAQQLDAAGSSRWLLDFWAAGFPPAAPLALLRWLASTHTGMLFAYPNGGPDGGSVLTLGVFAVGAWTLWRTHNRTMLAVLLGPFVLTMAASALRLYPYGVHPRIALFLAPAICLLAGVGLARLLDALPRRAAVPATRVALGLLAALGLGQMALDVLRPFSIPDAALVRSVAAEIVEPLGDRDCVVSLNEEADLLLPQGGPEGPQVGFRWYLRRAAASRHVGLWDGSPETLVSPSRVRLVVFQRRGRPDAEARMAAWDRRSSGLFTPGIVWGLPASHDGVDRVLLRDDRPAPRREIP